MDDFKISNESYYITKTMNLVTGFAMFILGLLLFILSFIGLFSEFGLGLGFAKIKLTFSVFILLISLLPIQSYYKLKRNHSKYSHWVLAIINVIITFIIYRHFFSLIFL